MDLKEKFVDPNIDFKSKSIEDRIQFIEFNGKKLPLPSEIEISESGTCNRKCIFCPRSAKDFKDVKKFISNELHEKLCKELSSLNYKGTVRYSGFVEPLIDKNIYNLVKMSRDYMPFSNIEIVTNGDVLNKTKLKKLFSNGLNRILISAYDGFKSAKMFEELCVDSGLTKEMYLIRHRYLSKEKDFGITLSNRGGEMEKAEYKIAKLDEALNLPCYIPSYTFFLDYQGDVLMCPHDWGKKVILGNLKEKKLLDIWFSKKSNLIRKKLLNANRRFTPCNVCDVQGNLMGKKNSEFFN